MKEQLTVRLPTTLGERLERTARQMRRKRSEVVRLALEAFFARQTVETGRDRGAVDELLGSLESGMPDLAERHRQAVLDSIRGE